MSGFPQDVTVVTTLRYTGAHWDRLRAALGEAQVLRFESPDEPGFAAALARADIALLAKDPASDLYSAPRLRWIHVDHAGLDKAARPEAFREGLTITGSAGRSSPVLAEHALFFALSLAYRSRALHEAQKARHWGIDGQEDLRGLYGRTLGIVGFGNTGRELAARAKAFGMTVLAYRRQPSEEHANVDRMFSAQAGDSLDILLVQSDFVVLALGLSESTFHLIGARELDLIGPRGYLINMARGPIVDEAELVRAVEAGRIAGAGLDTFEVEPLAADSPLWAMENVIITPHSTPAVPDRTARSLDIICENIHRFANDEPLVNRLTPADLYTRPSGRR